MNILEKGQAFNQKIKQNFRPRICVLLCGYCRTITNQCLAERGTSFRSNLNGGIPMNSFDYQSN
ncbi:hypothetical protein T06_4801 [Trichinella sp. T6]|nr:hypothetical protein T06_4801 [Trichinella sp. T6]